MSRKRTLEDDLFALASLRDDDIDTSDISETTDFSDAQRARYFPLVKRGYDIRAIANWCISRAYQEKRNVGTLWLNKIVYFIYERAIQDWNVLLSNARLEAWKHGPVFREIYFDEKVERKAEFFKRFNAKNRQMEVAREDFAVSDIDMFERVWRELGQKSGLELRELSHVKDSPWDMIWNQQSHKNFGMEIDVATILGRKANTDGRKREEDKKDSKNT